MINILAAEGSSPFLEQFCCVPLGVVKLSLVGEVSAHGEENGLWFSDIQRECAKSSVLLVHKSLTHIMHRTAVKIEKNYLIQKGNNRLVLVQGMDFNSVN